MNLDSVAFDSESESVSDETTCSRAPAQARLSETSVRKIADLFQDDYAKLVHYLVARTKSWPEARDIAAQAFAQVLGAGEDRGLHRETPQRRKTR